MNILLWDLETAGVNALKSDLGCIVNFGYKWLGEKSAHVITIDEFPGWFSSKRGLNDKPLLKAALKLMAQADLIVAHYGDRFDKKFFAGRCVINGLQPPPQVKTRDTWYIAKRAFNFSCNRLGHLAKRLNLSQKKHEKSASEWPGWWMRAMAGDKRAIHEMGEYCKQDVQTLEQVYLRLRPYDDAHPHGNAPKRECVCGGVLHSRGLFYTQKQIHRRLRCRSCGRWEKEALKK